MGNISIVLIEDHNLTRMGLKTALQQQSGFNLVGEAANGTDGLALLNKHLPDVAIVDIGLPDIDGIELTRQFKQNHADNPEVKTKILILTMHEEELEVLGAFAAGADSYCIKNIDVNQLMEAVKITADGHPWIDPAIAEIVLQQVRQENANPKSASVSIEGLSSEDAEMLKAYPLTQRELEILELIVGGYSNKEIGSKLHISLGTVKTHVCNLLGKLSASDRTEAAVRALRAGLVK